METVQFNKSTIGPYEVGELLGMGGMGMVYRAYQPSLERQVALKVLARTGKSSAIFDQRFVREAAIAASLEHPHIVPIYDYGSTDELRYVAMRLLIGGTLSDRLNERREFQQPYTPAEVNRILAPLASAIDYAHKRGIVHRDIKPSNIMFDGQDRPYLVDFGIARLIDTNSGMTQTGHALGTPSYMPPEQWMGKEATSPSDVYALGAVTFEMLTLHPPFEASNPFALMQQHVQSPPPLVNDLQPDLPPLVGLAVRQALQKLETDRFPTAGLFAEAFTEATQGRTSSVFTSGVERWTSSTITERPTLAPDTVNLNLGIAPPKPAKSRRRSLLVLFILLLGVLACGGYAALTQGLPGFGLIASMPGTSTSTVTDIISPTPTTASATASLSPTSTLSPTATMTFTMTASQTMPLSPVATSSDKRSGISPTKPAAPAATSTTQPTTVVATAQSTIVLPTTTPRPTITPSRTASPPTSVPPTAIPPTPVPPTAVPPTSPPASNGNGGGNSGSGNGNGGGNGSGNGGGNSGSGNGGGNGNGNGNSGGG